MIVVYRIDSEKFPMMTVKSLWKNALCVLLPSVLHGWGLFSLSIYLENGKFISFFSLSALYTNELNSNIGLEIITEAYGELLTRSEVKDKFGAQDPLR